MAVSDVSQTDEIASTLARLFPLPLTTLEQFMVADARIDYPMMIDLELRFLGCMDRAACEAGLAFALSRNPLFTCLIERQDNGSLAWIPSNQLPAIVWTTFEAPLDENYDQWVDLTKEIGLRIYVLQGVDKSSILLHYHHACADGIGGFAFAEDFIAGYATAFAPHEPVTPRPLDPIRLLQRGEIGTAGRSAYQRLKDAVIGAREGIRFSLQKPNSLEIVSKPEAVAAEPPARLGYQTEICSKELTVGLRRVATSKGATVNDVLMRDLFLTLRRWNVEADPQSDRGNLRIMMPQNLRAREDGQMPAANVMSVAFLTRKTSLCDTPDALLASLQEETEAVRRGQLSIYSLGALATLQSMGVLDKILRKPICLSTAILTNVGDPSRRFTIRLPRSAEGVVAGNLVFLGIGGVPPIRPLTRAALTATSGANAIVLCLRCDRRSYTAADTKRLLDSYVAQLAATAEQSKQLPVN